MHTEDTFDSQRKPFEEPIRRILILRAPDLADVINGKVGVLVITASGFREDELLQICKSLSSELRPENYSNAPGVGKLGTFPCLFETQGQPQLKDLYYKSGAETMEQLSKCFPAGRFPVHSLMGWLCGIHPAGAKMANFEGRGTGFAGLCRRTTGAVLAHNDKLERDLNVKKSDLGYITQVAFNMYLQVPESGGELKVWNLDLPQVAYEELCDGNYGLDPEILGAPDAVYRPAAGEVAFFMPRNLHAISESTGKERITMSAFIAYGGQEVPLGVWS